MLALFLALGGSSYAALRVGSGQIVNNSVRSKDLRNNEVRSTDVRNGSLLTKDFKAGQLPQGATGATGPRGPTGLTGLTGPAGRSALSPLLSGETIRGAWALRGDGTDPGSIEVTGVTFPIPAPQPVDSRHVVIPGNDPITGDGCTGSAAAPVAGAGFVCVYIATASLTNSAGGFGALSPSVVDSGATGDGSPNGFMIVVNGMANFFANGTWAYRAP